MRALFEAEPGTYVLTDFLIRSFDRTVLAELGLDRYPELWPDYFGHYRRLVWLAQDPEPGLTAQAEQVAARFGLPLTVVETGTGRLERELERLLTDDGMWSMAPTPTKECGRWRNRPQTTREAVVVRGRPEIDGQDRPETGSRGWPATGSRRWPDAAGRGWPDAGGRGGPDAGSGT
jgi:hypothetical protein